MQFLLSQCRKVAAWRLLYGLEAKIVTALIDTKQVRALLEKIFFSQAEQKKFQQHVDWHQKNSLLLKQQEIKGEATRWKSYCKISIWYGTFLACTYFIGIGVYRQDGKKNRASSTIKHS